MREIIPNVLWIGTARDARDPPGIMSRGITAVIDLAMEETPAHLPRDIVYCRFPLVDGEGNNIAIRRTAVMVVAFFIESKTPTLISCSGGMSRSPAIAAAALSRSEHVTPDEALLRFASSGPHDVSTVLWTQIKCVR
jgi:protein-tyrosine phosphatase